MCQVSKDVNGVMLKNEVEVNNKKKEYFEELLISGKLGEWERTV